MFDFFIFQTTEGIGVMIIEGSHKFLGKGIFISDIQQDSLANKVLGEILFFNPILRIPTVQNSYIPWDFNFFIPIF